MQWRLLCYNESSKHNLVDVIMAYTISCTNTAAQKMTKILADIQANVGIPEHLRSGKVIFHNCFGKLCPMELAAIRFDDEKAKQLLIDMDNGEVGSTQSKIALAIKVVKMSDNEFMAVLVKDANRVYKEFKSYGLIK